MKVQNKTSKISLRTIQANILSTGLLFNLGVGRREISPSEFPALLTWAMTAKKNGKLVGQKLRHILFPKTIKELKCTPLLPMVSIEREMSWFTAVIVANAKRVSRYLELASQYEKMLLEANAFACLEILQTIEAEFGLSLWLIETKIAHLQHFEGVEAQKKYLATVKAEGQGNVPWLATSFSVRNEEPTTFFRYLSQTVDTLDDVIDSSLRASLKFQSIGIVPDDAVELSGLLHYEANSSLIDIYNTLFEVLQKFVIDTGSEMNQSAVKKLIQLAEKVNDIRLNRLMFLAGKCEETFQVAFEPRKLVTKSAANDLPNKEEYLLTLNSWPAAWRVLAERLVDSEVLPKYGQNIQANYVSALHEIYSKGFLAEHRLAETLKSAFAFRWTSFARLMHGILFEELSVLPVLDFDDALTRFVVTPYLDSDFLAYLPSCCTDIYSAAISKAYEIPAGTPFDIWARKELYVDVPKVVGLDENRHTLKKAEQLYSSCEFSQSIIVATDALHFSSTRERRLAARLISASLHKIGDIEALVKLTADTVVNDPGATDLMPVAECAKILNGKEIRKKLAGNITIPIVLFLNSTNYSDEYDKALAYSYEDFLITHKLEKPSQLKSKSLDFDKHLLVFYLRHVCTPSIMKVSSVFNGSVELQNERLAIFTLLLELDEPNAKTYESEIREITRAQVIRSGVRHVEQSKMSIDVTAIRKLCDKKLKESFFRYRAMVAAGISPSADFAEAYMQLLSDGKPLPSEFLQVPTDEAGTLLRELLSAIFLESTNNPMHGLDCYLSMRIRHGALSGQLRGPLELEKLITQRTAGMNSYASNEIWLEHLAGITTAAKEGIDLGLCIFSARYDSLIERLTNELIQIYSLEKPSGLFYLDTTSIHLRFLATTVTPTTTFDEFFDECINLFWTSVENCLGTVQLAIDSIVKPEINEVFYTLQSTISRAAPSQYTADLDRAVRTAQTNSLQACEQMKDWFKLPTPRAEPFFEVEQLIDIGLQCVQRIHKDFNPIIEKDILELPRVAGALTIFSDIFFILFDNARKYSHLGTSPKLWITVVRDSQQALSFLVENEVSAESDMQSCTERMKAIRALIESGGYHGSLRTEGGTGLIKLKKIIGPSHLLEFGYVSDTKFFVRFNLTLREISL
ncbi:hypothetical protein V2K05_24835 [Pseudomonas alliivorans]|nr:hypothetical protein [Pseudomonas alliivorans]MEE4973540.1 hypothetical protein [Pseudomonas alliivorans]MEE4977870.1 hypothetical protein [Pseudomonas alliivorans]MEE4982506.1 hypothetical protein [Pseudomonas alliivorans]MEE5005066.1 hypothetical protein [Pseudomonas alliivorans]